MCTRGELVFDNLDKARGRTAVYIGQTFFEPGSVVAAFAWCILMALNVTFSNVWGIILREWRGASRKTVGVLVCGLAILIFSLVFPNLF